MRSKPQCVRHQISQYLGDTVRVHLQNRQILFHLDPHYDPAILNQGLMGRGRPVQQVFGRHQLRGKWELPGIRQGQGTQVIVVVRR